jgi:hypothetical protein
MRTYATFSPAGPRSILKTRPCAGATGSPPAAGSSVTSAFTSGAIPAPVMADPKNTGCAPTRPTWSARARRNRSSGRSASAT